MSAADRTHPRLGEEPVKADAVHTRPDGQVVVDVFPVTGYDRLLFNGYKAQVWMEPGISAAETRRDAAKMYRGSGYDQPGVCLVLGAGNLGTITTLDVIDQLYARGNVCAVKMNPVNDYLGPFYEKIFSEFISLAGCASCTAAQTSAATWHTIARSIPFT